MLASRKTDSASVNYSSLASTTPHLAAISPKRSTRVEESFGTHTEAEIVRTGCAAYDPHDSLSVQVETMRTILRRPRIWRTIGAAKEQKRAHSTGQFSRPARSSPTRIDTPPGYYNMTWYSYSTRYSYSMTICPYRYRRCN